MAKPGQFTAAEERLRDAICRVIEKRPGREGGGQAEANRVVFRLKKLKAKR